MIFAMDDKVVCIIKQKIKLRDSKIGSFRMIMGIAVQKIEGNWNSFPQVIVTNLHPFVICTGSKGTLRTKLHNMIFDVCTCFPMFPEATQQ